MEYTIEKTVERIKNLMNETKITNKQLAAKSGISVHTLGKVLRLETKEPSVSIIIAVADALGVNADYLIYGKEINIFEAFKVTEYEREHIKKYRALDQHGIKIVNYVLNEEYARCESTRKTSKQAQSEAIIPIVTAAQGGGINTEISPENENAVLDKLEELEKNERKNNLGL